MGMLSKLLYQTYTLSHKIISFVITFVLRGPLIKKMLQIFRVIK